MPEHAQWVLSTRTQASGFLPPIILLLPTSSPLLAPFEFSLASCQESSLDRAMYNRIQSALMRASFPMVSTTNIFSPSSWRCVLQGTTLRAKRTEPLRHQSGTECITLPFKTRYLMCTYDHFCTGYTINLAKLGFLSAKLIGIANFTLTLENYGIFLFLLKEALISRTTAPASHSGRASALRSAWVSWQYLWALQGPWALWTLQYPPYLLVLEKLNTQPA